MAPHVSLTASVNLPYPSEGVWPYLADADLLARWWATGGLVPQVGHEFLVDMKGWGQVPCRVVEVDPGRRLVYTFTPDWTLDWQLVDDGGSTTLTLEHSGFDLDNPMHRTAFDNMGPGWADVVLPRLAAVMAEDAH